MFQVSPRMLVVSLVLLLTTFFRHKNSAANDPNPASNYYFPTGQNPPVYTRSPNTQQTYGWTGMRTGQNTLYTFNDSLNGLSYVRGATTDWNYTLGPDKSLVRQPPPLGSAQDLLGPGLSDDLVTPFRAPQMARTCILP